MAGSRMGLRWKVSPAVPENFPSVTDNNFHDVPAAFGVTATSRLFVADPKPSISGMSRPGVTRNAVMQVTSAEHADRPALCLRIIVLLAGQLSP